YGQHVIIDEKHGLVVATNAHSDKMFPDSMLVRHITACMTDKKLYQQKPARREKTAYHKLMQEFQAFCNDWGLPKVSKEAPSILYAIKQKKLKEADVLKVKDMFSLFDGKRLHIDQASIKLFPYMLQGMYQCPPFVVTDIAFKKQENTIKICFYKERNKKENEKREYLIIEAGYGKYCHQTITLGQDKQEIAVKAYPATDEDGHSVIKLDIVFPAAGFSRIIKFFILENRIGIECQEYPDMWAIAGQVLYGETTLAGTKIDLTDKLPESVRVFVEHKVEPNVNGYFAEHRKV
ncbi:MAG: hypothetical protein K2H34_00420, partial [Lachnospiraceae bacterium]|nr:hypothetical protein [Lachnospiraceae bacterium]